MNNKALFPLVLAILLLTACSAAPRTQPSFDPTELIFDGEKAFAIETARWSVTSPLSIIRLP
jgi:outer membrane biogenesis lipoprotein LolB